MTDTTTLIIRQLEVEGPPTFQIVREQDGRSGAPVTIPSPHGQQVEGRPDSNLIQELRWYLESFLEYPFRPSTERANRMLDALGRWGEQAFCAVFENTALGRMFDAAAPDDYAGLTLRVISDDAGVLAWPWAALRDPEVGVLGRTCQVERRVAKDVREAPPLPKSLPADAVDVLLVIARSFERDIACRSVGRPLIDFVESRNLPARVTVLRPPTFKAFREHLEAHKGRYHVVHFDGHIGVSDNVMAPHVYAPGGHLHFESENAIPDDTEAYLRKTRVTPEQLGAVLREAGVPTVVLNACCSGRMDGATDDPVASVAVSLLKSGVRNVVVMAYHLYVSAAGHFLLAFYTALFEEGDVAGAVLASQKALFDEPARVCARGTYPLQDWLVPMLYQQVPFSFDFAKDATPPVHDELELGESLFAAQDPYGFIGRDGPLLTLERSLRRPEPAVLIHGLGGVGKTTLARGFCRWLARTGGLGEGCRWIGFQGVVSAEYVINQMGGPLLGDAFIAMPMGEKVSVLARLLCDHQFLFVWDNFEVAACIDGSLVAASALTDEDRRVLDELLGRMRGGRSKVIITSRSTEEWLGAEHYSALPLKGMTGEESWAFFAAVLRDLGRTVDRSDPDQVELMKLLAGHPLAMRVILPRLEKETAGVLLDKIRTDAAMFSEEDPAAQHLFAALSVPLSALPEVLRPLLTPLALHEGYMDIHLLVSMSDQIPNGPNRASVERFMDFLSTAGLIRHVGQGVVEMHPMLTGYLKCNLLPKIEDDTQARWPRAFVNIMGRLADAFVSKSWSEQRVVFHLHGANLRAALAVAQSLGMFFQATVLTRALAVFARNTRCFTEVRRLFADLTEYRGGRATHDIRAGGVHRLDRFVQVQRDYEAVKSWYKKNLTMEETQDLEHITAVTYGRLGRMAEEQQNYEIAEEWYKKALAIAEKQGDDPINAVTYHQLGMIAHEQQDYETAERWYRKSLAIEEKQGNEHGAAITYGQLGILAALQGAFEDAGRLLVRCIKTFHSCNDPESAARNTKTYLICYQYADDDNGTRAKLTAIWQEAGLGDLKTLWANAEK